MLAEGDPNYSMKYASFLLVIKATCSMVGDLFVGAVYILNYR
jgi:hypothetical protein